MSKRVWVRVPGSSGNLGSGFDTASAALAVYLELEIEVVPAVQGDRLDAGNAMTAAALPILRLAFPKSGFRFRCQSEIPMGKGLGSSAAARVAALAAASLLAGKKPDDAVLNQAARWEGHADNAAASLHGGFCLSWRDGENWACRSVPMPRDLMAVLCIPEFELPTKKARAVLPAKISHRDAAFNLSRLAALVSALESKNHEWLEAGLGDRLHQPFRARLIPGLNRVIEAALNEGAYGACLSGAGPSVLAVAGKKQDLEAIGYAMRRAFARAGVTSSVLRLPFNNRGIEISS